VLLIESIIKSLDQPEIELDEIWAEESEKRLKAYREGKLESFPLLSQNRGNKTNTIFRRPKVNACPSVANHEKRAFTSDPK